MRSLVVTAIVVALFAQPCLAGKFKADEPPDVPISGRITDHNGRPVKGALVVLTDRETGQRLQTKSDAEGHFKLLHERTDFETLQVIGPPKSGLAQAFLTDIPAEESRHVLLRLLPGVEVTGKVVGHGRPLKDVPVKLIGKNNDAMHHSAEARTNGKGEFKVTITPGEKVIEVADVRDESLVATYREKRAVTARGALPTIVVPSNLTADKAR